MAVTETEMLTCPKTSGENWWNDVPSLRLLRALLRARDACTPETSIKNNQCFLCGPRFNHPRVKTFSSCGHEFRAIKDLLPDTWREKFCHPEPNEQIHNLALLYFEFRVHVPRQLEFSLCDEIRAANFRNQSRRDVQDSVTYITVALLGSVGDKFKILKTFITNSLHCEIWSVIMRDERRLSIIFRLNREKAAE